MMKARVPSPAEQHETLTHGCPWLDPGEQGEKLEVHEFPTFMVLRLATLTKNTLTRRYLDPFGISLPEWRLLALVARYDSLLFSEITTGSSMDKGQVSRTLKSIHRKGLVSLDAVPSDDNKPRSTSISPRLQVAISPKGRALFNRILPASRSWQARLIDSMSAEERQVFHSVALRLLREIPEMAGDAGLGDDED
jgi:DNA-binding MarR family transcriptional regulator